jgi:hypothetical protein
VKLDATKIISVLVLSTLALNLSTAYAHDPYAPEYWPKFQHDNDGGLVDLYRPDGKCVSAYFAAEDI